MAFMSLQWPQAAGMDPRPVKRNTDRSEQSDRYILLDESQTVSVPRSLDGDKTVRHSELKGLLRKPVKNYLADFFR